MKNKLKNFIYSQNSINTYKSCPLKFRYKYIDKINWKKDDIESREYYENLRIGSEFHLLCERYFSNIPLGITEETNPKFIKWMDKIKKLLPMDSQSKDLYLPEYEIRYKLEGDIVSAKYDLIIIKEDSIEIWDWKTENRKVDYKNAQDRIQTIIYMFLAKEVIPKLHNKNIKFEDITMKYYQPEYEDQPISITYSEEVHRSYKNRIKQYIKMIKNIKFHDMKNDKHCKYCEFDKLCNTQDEEYELIEEETHEH